VVGVALAIGGWWAVRYLVHRAEDKVHQSVLGTSCPFLDAAAASAALGERAQVGAGGVRALAGNIIDNRVLADAPSCTLTYASDARLARVAVRRGAAVAGFASALRAARGAAPGRGDGAGDSGAGDSGAGDSGAGDSGAGDSGAGEAADGYYGGAVRQLGDEAFCTRMNSTGAAGVLVRSRDTLVYAAVTPRLHLNGTDSPIDQDFGAEACRVSQRLAAAVLKKQAA
jgi:hypothetical protein